MKQRSINFKVSLGISVWVGAVVLSFKQFFFLFPFENGINFFTLAQGLTVLGWIALVFGPPIVLWKPVSNPVQRKWALWIVASFWTISTLLVKVLELIYYKQIWAEYLTNYPVFIVMEWLVPIFYIVLGLRLGDKSGK